MTMARRSDAVVSVREGCPVDPVIAGIALVLLVMGLIMVASASTEISARNYGTPFYLMTRHAAYVVIALIAGLSALLVPIKVWQKGGLPLALLGLFLLVIVLVPGIGREANGAQRWISLGFFNLQGSEFVKLFAVVYLAAFMVKREPEQTLELKQVLQPLIVLGCIILLLLGQPDFGAAVVIMLAAMGIVFLAGTPLKYFAPLVLVGAVLTLVLILFQPYRLARWVAFIDPWAHQYEGGYQLTQALIAFGRGEWLGLGLGNSIQKLFFLPEAHTDFLFSIIAEELGLVGAALVIGLFAILVIRGLVVGRDAYRAGNHFHAFLAYGVALLLGAQATINLGVNLGLLPTKGLTLPLMSYGGNSLIISCVLVAILLRIEFEGRQVKPTGRARYAR